MTLYTTFDSPLGELLLTGERSGTAPGGTALTSLSLPGQKGGAAVRPDRVADDGAFAHIASRLRAYFAGTLTRFDVELTDGGTDFQRRVWRALEDIPYGETRTYGEVAERIGAPRAAVRAVGTAVGANPLLLVRPCHRVIGADGQLTGYAGGLPAKRHLLAHEGALTTA